MTDLLSIGRSGVVAYRAALSTVGENVSNVETEGYTRRTVVLNESAVSSSKDYHYKTATVFGGVTIGAVQRVYDNYRSSYARFATSQASRADVKATWLDTAEGALDDSQVGLGVKMSSVFTAAEALSADVTSDTSRRTVLIALSEVANQFNNTASSLQSAAEGIASSALTTVDKLNADLQLLAEINTSLARATPGSAGMALLQDRRDATLQRISGAIGIKVHIENDGRADVTVLGNDTVKLVDSSENRGGYVGLLQGNDGRLALVSSGYGPETPIFPQSGALAGYVDVANTIATRRDALDDVAATFADVINDWNTAGLDQDGNAGVALMSGTTAATIAVATTDTRVIAATSAGGVANGNALALKNFRNSNGPEAKWTLLVATHAQSVNSAKAEQAAAAAQKDGALQQLDEVTGVDLDVEAAQLLRFQQAYSGSARIIQVARETLQEIFGLFN
jgi:flagellar hook-associated protein 1